jgi:hypothetical protein
MDRPKQVAVGAPILGAPIQWAETVATGGAVLKFVNRAGLERDDDAETLCCRFGGAAVHKIRTLHRDHLLSSSLRAFSVPSRGHTLRERH